MTPPTHRWTRQATRVEPAFGSARHGVSATPPDAPTGNALSRRAILSLAAGGALAHPGRAHAEMAYATEAFPGGATVLVAGPEDGAVDRWARIFAPLFGRTLGPGIPLRRDVTDGVDGVTGANRFDARTIPDGSTALLAPGAAALAWLAGDPRVHFDVARWVPTLACVSPGLLVSTLDPGEMLRTDRKLRYAGITPVGADLPALLGLDLMGVAAVPTFGFPDHQAVAAALGQGAFDVACLHGDSVPAKLADMRLAGARPLFTFGGLDPSEVPRGDAALAALPTLAERVAAGPERPLATAWRAAAAASQLDFVLALPSAAPAAMIARWRRACEEVVTSQEVQLTAASLSLRPLAGAATSAATEPLAIDAAAQLALRGWLGDRLNWHPA